MKSKYKIAAIQMCSNDNLQQNLVCAADLTATATRQMANLVSLPEYFCGLGQEFIFQHKEKPGGKIHQAICKIAKQNKIWLIAGSIPIIAGSKSYNSSLLIDPQGNIQARYDKRHLFVYQDQHAHLDESAYIKIGKKIIVTKLPWASLGMAICFDLRFCEHFLSLRPAEIICVPSAFTVPTGKAHWQTLCTARAILNQAYILAPAQAGKHPGGRMTYGHSMIVDPWGKILAQATNNRPQVLIADYDQELVKQVRSNINCN